MNLKLRVSALLLIIAGGVHAAGEHARSVILFLGDAGGIPTLNAAAIYAHDRPQSLFIQSMPHLALSDTSSLDAWVTDSAAGMTAIVTGHKTNDHSFDLRLRGGKKGAPLAPQIAATAEAPPPAKPVISVENSHTGEDILVAAQGPGAERVHGFIPNTRIFNVMLSAYGWEESQ